MNRRQRIIMYRVGLVLAAFAYFDMKYPGIWERTHINDNWHWSINHRERAVRDHMRGKLMEAIC